MKINKIKPVYVLIMFLYCTTSFAGVSSDLGSFFKGLGYDTNATDATAYKGQTAGYYTGGSLFARNTVRDYQLLSIQLPKVRAGCGGIDIYTGAFSFVNSQNLVNAMNNIANNAVSYATMLGLESVSPEIANEMQTLQAFANQVNQSNISSCESAATLVGAVWPKTEEAQRQVCQSIATDKNFASDYTAARMNCGTGGAQTSTLSSGASDPDYKDLVLQNTNIAWNALQKNGFLSSDAELSELFMSLSGTIIIQSGSSDNEPNKYSVVPTLAGNEQLVKALLYGGDATIYTCDTTQKCLNPSLHSITVNDNDALVKQVRSLLDDMYQHILADTPIMDTEKGLLNSTNIPLYKMLSVEAAYTGGSSLLDLDSYAEIIAVDILNQYLNENLDIIQKSAGTMQYPAEIVEEFNKSITQARTDVSKIEVKSNQAVDTNLQLIQRTELMEQQLSGQLSSHLSQSMAWTAGLK